MFEWRNNTIIWMKNSLNRPHFIRSRKEKILWDEKYWYCRLNWILLPNIQSIIKSTHRRLIFWVLGDLWDYSEIIWDLFSSFYFVILNRFSLVFECIWNNLNYRIYYLWLKLMMERAAVFKYPTPGDKLGGKS